MYLITVIGYNFNELIENCQNIIDDVLRYLFNFFVTITLIS